MAAGAALTPLYSALWTKWTEEKVTVEEEEDQSWFTTDGVILDMSLRRNCWL